MTYPLLTDNEYQKLTKDAKLIKRTRTQIRLLLNKENKIIKHIYKRKLLSSSTIWPYATRFIKNAKRLTEKNINVPTVYSVHFYPKLNCDILIYEYVEGPTLFQIAEKNDFSFLPKLAEYITHLHNLGIYFHDIHLENIILLNNEFTLLDLESVKIMRKSLTANQRARNLAHLFNRKEDIPFYEKYGWETFLDQYFGFAQLSERFCAKLKKRLLPAIPIQTT